MKNQPSLTKHTSLTKHILALSKAKNFLDNCSHQIFLDCMGVQFEDLKKHYIEEKLLNILIVNLNKAKDINTPIYKLNKLSNSRINIISCQAKQSLAKINSI